MISIKFLCFTMLLTVFLIAQCACSVQTGPRYLASNPIAKEDDNVHARVRKPKIYSPTHFLKTLSHKFTIMNTKLERVISSIRETSKQAETASVWDVTWDIISVCFYCGCCMFCCSSLMILMCATLGACLGFGTWFTKRNVVVIAGRGKDQPIYTSTLSEDDSMVKRDFGRAQASGASTTRVNLPPVPSQDDSNAVYSVNDDEYENEVLENNDKDQLRINQTDGNSDYEDRNHAHKLEPPLPPQRLNLR